MFNLIKSLEYMTIGSLLLDKEKKILYSNPIFNSFFNCDEFTIKDKFINDDYFKQLVINNSNLDIINNDLESIHDNIINIREDDTDKWVRVNCITIKNGTVYYILTFENVSESYSISYLYDQIFNNTNMGIIILKKHSDSFIIKDINEMGCGMINKNKNDILNNNITDFIYFKIKSKLIKSIDDVYNDGIKKEIKKCQCGDDTWRNITIIKMETGDIILMIDDITTEIQILEKLENSDKYKTEFLSNMSHEIRSPINSIIGFSEMLNDVKDDNDKLNKYIEIIQNSSESLMKIVNDILDLSKIEEGKLEIIKSNFNLNSILEELFVTNKNKIKNKNIELKLSLPKNINKILNDSFRLGQIINNLVNNSIKFTEKGYIEIGYKKQDNNVLFYVKDTGIGIKEEDIKKIFNRYSQAKSGKISNKIIGHGLGLSISNELVKLMGGTIWVESEFGVGSTFYFTLPNDRKVGRNKSIINDTDYYDTDFTNKKILIVEDIDFNIKLLESYLENTNANIIIAVDGNDALLKYNDNRNDLDLILMDIQLPEMNGNDVTKIIRTIDKDTPIIAQTAYAMKDDIDNLMLYGFNDIINKPIKKEDLLRMIYKYINLKS